MGRQKVLRVQTRNRRQQQPKHLKRKVLAFNGRVIFALGATPAVNRWPLEMVVVPDEVRVVSNFLKHQREVQPGNKMLRVRDAEVATDALLRETSRATGVSRLRNRDKDKISNSRRPWEALASNLALDSSLAIAREVR